LIKGFARFSENVLFFCRPHLTSVKGEISCGSTFVILVLGKISVKKKVPKKSEKKSAKKKQNRAANQEAIRFAFQELCGTPNTCSPFYPCRPSPSFSSTFAPCFQQL